MKKVISTTNAPAAIGPYSQAIEANGFVFASGQIPVNPETGEIPEGIEAQAEQDPQMWWDNAKLAARKIIDRKSVV